MDEETPTGREYGPEAAEQLAEARRQIAEGEQIRREMEEAAADPAVQQESIRQSNLIYGGLAGAGLIVVQPFLTANSLDLPAKICVLAFAVATPLLAALLLLNRQEEFRRQTTRDWIVELARAIAQGAAFVGITAAFWHISMIAGIVFLGAGMLALGVHSAGYVDLEFDARFRSRFRRRTGSPSPDSADSSDSAESSGGSDASSPPES